MAELYSGRRGLVGIYKNINSDWTYVRGGRVLQVYEKNIEWLNSRMRGEGKGGSVKVLTFGKLLCLESIPNIKAILKAVKINSK